MTDAFPATTQSDFEAVFLAESYDVFSNLVGPYLYRVSGQRGQQQALFKSSEVQTLFYIRVHEFLAAAPEAPTLPGLPAQPSLLSAGTWLSQCYPEAAKAAGFDVAYQQATEWFGHAHRLVFWAPSIGRHLRLEVPMSTLIAMRANREKHHILRLGREIQRLQSLCDASDCSLSIHEAIAAREEFESHLKGMLAYHATEVAEIVGRCFLALYFLVRPRYDLNPTNVLDDISPPGPFSNDLFRYMYASTIVSLSRWTETRIVSSVPETASIFKPVYPQHAEWSVVEAERA